MPILDLPPNPARPRDANDANGEAAAGDPSLPSEDQPLPPVKLRSSRYGQLEEHELIHLLDSIDDEVARARFRESIYKSIIICMAVAWFLLYGPRVLFHQPQYKDFVTAMKDRDKQITYLDTPRIPKVPPRPPARSTPDRKTLQQLREQPRATPAAPQPQPAPTALPEQARVTPPVEQPALPLPPAPSRSTPSQQQPLPDAPRPTIAQNAPSAGQSIQDALRHAQQGRGGAEYGTAPGAAGPLGAGGSIISDTMGVDFSAYLRRVVGDTRRNWQPLIPEEVQPPLRKRGITGIRFTILPGGQIGAMTLETPSGDQALDKAAWYAITSEGAFPPLPREFHGPQIELRFGFYYNEQPPQ